MAELGCLKDAADYCGCPSCIRDRLKAKQEKASQWTESTPTKSGWYWYRNRALSEGQPLMVFFDKARNEAFGICVTESQEGLLGISLDNALWLGPLEIPEAPKVTDKPEQPLPMLCVHHGGSPACEAGNKTYGFTCPKCDMERDDFEEAEDPTLQKYKTGLTRQVTALRALIEAYERDVEDLFVRMRFEHDALWRAMAELQDLARKRNSKLRKRIKEIEPAAKGAVAAAGWAGVDLGKADKVAPITLAQWQEVWCRTATKTGAFEDDPPVAVVDDEWESLWTLSKGDRALVARIRRVQEEVKEHLGDEEFINETIAHHLRDCAEDIQKLERLVIVGSRINIDVPSPSPKEIEWTTDTPTECGWYWHESKHCAGPVLGLLELGGEWRIHYRSGRLTGDPIHMIGRWAGPIDPPPGWTAEGTKNPGAGIKCQP